MQRAKAHASERGVPVAAGQPSGGSAGMKTPHASQKGRKEKKGRGRNEDEEERKCALTQRRPFASPNAEGT